MNPQYMTSYGGPPGFQNNRPSPPSTQSFQNVPLSTSDSGHADSDPSHMKANQFPPSLIGGPVGKAQIPSSQLPPSQGQHLMASNPFNQQSNKISSAPPVSAGFNVQNGSPAFQNGPAGILLFEIVFSC